MTDDNGVPKGMKIILKERGINTMGMNAHDMRQKLKTFDDFKHIKTLLEEYVEDRGHICTYPKYHCELSPIEHVWCQLKQYTWAHVDGTIVHLRKIVPEGLNSVTVEQIKKYFRMCCDYERVYEKN